MLERAGPPARRVEPEVALSMLAGNVFPGRDWLGTIPTELLMTSTTYQQIQLRCKRDLIGSQLKDRLGAAAELLVARLPQATESVLARVGSLVATMRSDEELVAALDALLPRE